MKKPSQKVRNAIKKHNESNHKFFLRYANTEKHHKRKTSRKRRNYQIWLDHSPDGLRFKERKNIFNDLCRKHTFTKAPVVVKIKGEFGIEEKDNLHNYIQQCSNLVDFNGQSLTIDLTECTRIWPSAITTLCSLAQWIELASRKDKKPLISQIPSINKKVNSYMDLCGLYDYVKIRKSEDTSYYNEEDIVKIRREMNKRNIEVREEEILSLVERHSCLTAEELEWFYCVILTEIFNNVTEHGISHKDKGWWILAQYHKRHKIISLCIADNGIGIRNTLLTGPQKDDILKQVKNTPLNDSDFIKKAMEENVSGAITASIKERKALVLKRYKSGSRRGNGLKRIQDTCRELGIELTILSHHGCISLDTKGHEIASKSLPSRIVAGTMYQLNIPTN